MDVTLTQLEYFVEAAARLSMTRAAERLNVAQSAVSSAVTQLERRIGTQLFIRQRSKGLVLTPEGELFLHDSRAILAHVEEVLDHAKGEGNNLTGRVRLVCFSTLSPVLLPELLAHLSKDYPGLEVTLTEADAAGCAAALLEGRADLALTYDLGTPSGITTTTMDSARPYICLPADHRLAERESLLLSELHGEPFILLDLPYSRDVMLSLLRQAGLEPEVRYRSASFETVRTFVANGHGFSLLHQRPRHQRTYDGGRVVTVEIEDDVPSLAVVLAQLQSQRTTARIRAVAQAIHHQVEKHRSELAVGAE
ncbi:LysR family transcriptional regulator [Kocuria sp. TGY1127_2]|uniref:LysR family transcriptional regulator n=1 Tax=Kocuria sp. TGY1127_2 TaxID=2711328 RepID=UPI0015C18BEF|nr:LysR family transcriptional regulator [Kocuria sp. TGY1127_2]